MQSYPKAIILARVSSKSQEEEGYSLDSQLKLLRNYCKNKKLKIVKEFKITETASKTQRRKVFRELLDYLTAHKIQHFVVEKTDRAVRNIKDAATIYDWIEEDDKRVLHCVKESLELHKWSTSQVKFMWGIFVAFAKQYTDSLREEAMKGWDEKLAQGWLPAVPPPGYKTVTQESKKIHVPDDEVAPLMERTFILAQLPDYNLRHIVQAMSEMGITNRKGKPYTKSHVHKILQNPFYVGVNRFNGKDHPGAQEPIISKKLFDAVQERWRTPRHQYRKHNPIFKSVIRCSDCNSLVTWQVQKSRYYGACQRTQEVCRRHPLLREDRVERQMIQALENIKDRGGKLWQQIEETLNIAQPERVSAYRQGIIKTLSMQLQRLQAMNETLYEDRLAGIISIKKYEERRAEFTMQSEQLMARRAKLQELEADLDQQIEIFPKGKSRIVDLYMQGTPSRKRAVLAIVFKSIAVTNGEVLLGH